MIIQTRATRCHGQEKGFGRGSVSHTKERIAHSAYLALICFEHGVLQLTFKYQDKWTAQVQRISVHSWLMVSASLACIYRSSTGPCSDMIKYIIALDTSLPLSATLKRLYEYHDSHQTTQAFTNQQSPNHHVRLLLKFTRMADERTV